MIVSRGALESRRSSSRLHLAGSVNQIDKTGTIGGDSVLSLPYSSRYLVMEKESTCPLIMEVISFFRTLLTNSSRSTGCDSAARHLALVMNNNLIVNQKPFCEATNITDAAAAVHACDDDEMEEPPYETLPNIDLTEDEIQLAQDNQAQDCSVISGHHIKAATSVETLQMRNHILLAAADLGDETRL